MSGETESKKPMIDERHEMVASLLNKYPEKMGLGILKPCSDTNRFLTMSFQEQRRLTAEECGEAATVLSQAATYIQLETNKMTADIKWCNKCIDWMIADHVAEMGSRYTPTEYRRVIAIRQNDVCTKLDAIITQAQLRVDVMAYMPTQIRGTAKSFSDLQQTKRSQRA